jgi:hypothetical protein
MQTLPQHRTRYQLLLNGEWIDLRATDDQAAIAEANGYSPKNGDRIEDNSRRVVQRYGKKSGSHHRDGHRKADRDNSRKLKTRYLKELSAW